MFGATIVIEDDSAIQDTLAEICLEVLGITVLRATTARAAIPIIEQNRPAVILLDLTLPDESGNWVAEQIRTRGWSSDVRLIILSARQSLGVEAGELGAFSFISKPFSLTDVVKVLKDAGAV